MIEDENLELMKSIEKIQNDIEIKENKVHKERIDARIRL
jgi:hypothetical protein